MKKSLFRRIAAGVAAAFSLVTIVEGSQVLLGISHPDYVVLLPLLMYNVTMGVVGLVSGVALWLNRHRALTLVAIIGAAHIIVLLIVGVMYFSGGAVALNSVRAMTMRSVIWLAIAWIAWKTEKFVGGTGDALHQTKSAN
ncbi:MAG: hypothetical protein ABI623_09795 [bacterium]